MFIHVPIPCRGKGANLQSRAAQVHSALFPRGAVLVLRVSKSGVDSALSKVPATSMVLVCSCPFPPVRRFSATELDHSVMFLVWVRFFWRSCTKNNLQTEAQSTFIYSIHFFSDLPIPHHLLDSFLNIQCSKINSTIRTKGHHQGIPVTCAISRRVPLRAFGPALDNSHVQDHPLEGYVRSSRDNKKTQQNRRNFIEIHYKTGEWHKNI